MKLTMGTTYTGCNLLTINCDSAFVRLVSLKSAINLKLSRESDRFTNGSIGIPIMLLTFSTGRY